MGLLKITHYQGGFFSCSTVALIEIHKYVMKHGKLPRVDRSSQYKLQRNNTDGDVTTEFFKEAVAYPDSWVIRANKRLSTDCMVIQWEDYRKLPFEYLAILRNMYFNPSDEVEELVDIDFGIGVLYRGNDKAREMKVPSYDAFFKKIDELLEKKERSIYLLPDECKFKHEMNKRYGDLVVNPILPCTDKNQSNNFYELPQSERKAHAKKFLAALITLSNCEEIVTHSGNVGLWAAIYRGKAEGIHQIFNDKWY